MLYPSRQDLPEHIPLELVVDYDTFHVDTPDGDFAAAMLRLRDSGVPRLFWTQRNGGHWVVTGADLVREVIEDAARFSNRAMCVPKQRPYTAVWGLACDLLEKCARLLRQGNWSVYCRAGVCPPWLCMRCCHRNVLIMRVPMRWWNCSRMLSCACSKTVPFVPVQH